jgi:hypothetical protein
MHSFVRGRRSLVSSFFQLAAGGPALPVRWMAPETLQDTTKWTAETEMWSFGVLLWEIFAFANQPYPSLGNSEIRSHVVGLGKLDDAAPTDEM